LVSTDSKFGGCGDDKIYRGLWGKATPVVQPMTESLLCPILMPQVLQKFSLHSTVRFLVTTRNFSVWQAMDEIQVHGT
jgi:hypothetical protein